MAVEDLQGVAKRRQELQAELTQQENQQRVLLEEKEQLKERLGSWQDENKELSAQEEKLRQRRKEIQKQIKQTAKTQTELEKKEQTLQHKTDQLNQELLDLDRLEKEFEEEIVLAKERRQKDEAWAQEQRKLQEEAKKEIEHQKQEQKEEQKRQNQRTSLEIDVSIQTEHNFFMGLTENISEGGLFIATYDELPIGSELDLRLNLPDSSPIETKAVVVWVREQNWFSEDLVPGVGVQFQDLNEEQTQTIRKFVEKREPLFFETDDLAGNDSKHP